MGHAAHFLRRLDRVSDGHVELALALYNDLELLREVLSRAALPEGAERVAISLDDPIEGPFVVVTREGRFVTCLGAGMLVSDLPIVTRERLDTAAARVERMREELGRVQALRESGAEGQVGLAFRRMQQQGPRFAREDAETLIRVQPLIERECLEHIKALAPLVEDAADRLVALRLDAPRRLSAAQQEHLLAFGDAVWTIAHVLVLLRSTSIRSMFERVEEESAFVGSSLESLARFTFEWGTFTHVARSLWFIASAGKRALAAVKAPSRQRLHDRLFRELALTAIALGSDKLRAEAQKALAARVAPTEDAGLPPHDFVAAHFAAQAHGIIDGSARNERMYLQVSRAYVAQVCARSTEVSQEQIDAVPEDVARIAYVSSQVTIHRSEELAPLLASMHALPWLVRASPAELFLPAEWAKKLLHPRSLADVLFWFRPYVENRCLIARQPPRRVEAAPGRNAPCPCGSGKKHKRCCGAA